MKLQRIPQFELPTADDVFNLIAEATGDGERIARELRQAAAAKTEAARLEAEHQGQLFPSNPKPQIKNHI
jgi:hypothetical protein